jgi:hypothetical protein
MYLARSRLMCSLLVNNHSSAMRVMVQPDRYSTVCLETPRLYQSHTRQSEGTRELYLHPIHPGDHGLSCSLNDTPQCQFWMSGLLRPRKILSGHHKIRPAFQCHDSCYQRSLERTSRLMNNTFVHQLFRPLRKRFATHPNTRQSLRVAIPRSAGFMSACSVIPTMEYVAMYWILLRLCFLCIDDARWVIVNEAKWKEEVE